MKQGVIVSLLLFALFPVGAESLWNPDFKGYLSGGRGLSKGDMVVIEIDASSSLSFSSSNNDSKNLTLEFSGGETGNLLSFLPQVKTGGTQTTKGAEQYSVKAQVPAVVTDVDATGRASVQGSRSVSLQGKEESIALTGWINPKDVDQKGVVPLTRVGDARLVFKTLLEPSEPILTDKDIQEIIAVVPTPAAAQLGAGAAGAPAAPAAASGGTAGQPAATTGAATQPAAAPNAAPAVAGVSQAAGPTAPTTTLSLTDTRKKELLLLYLNRLIDVLFSP
jgi:hypothetical protein